MSGQHILVVEDHEPLLTAIRGILEIEDYTVSTAMDGVQALEMMEEIHPDLIVADIMMPRMDGYDLYRAIRARPEWTAIPFIFLTAKAGKEDILRGKEMGVEDYLTKPFVDPQELMVAVRARLERARAIREATEVEFAQLKQQIINTLGHELRTPLTYVCGYTDLAMADVSSLSPDDLYEFLQGIRQGTDRLVRLVEDFLLLVQIDTGRTMEEFDFLTYTRRDLGTIVERIVHQYEAQAASCGLTLEVKTTPDLPPVRLCENFFVNILGRLVDNAIKFSQGKGERVAITVQATDGWVEVTVQDGGVGIPAEEMLHLFERFRQIGREEMEQQGIGLGLAIAQELTRLHGGEITVESKVGEGSTFIIRLPVAEAT